MSVNKINLIGCVMGDLLVIEDISKYKKRKYKCECIKTGVIVNVMQNDLLSGKKRSALSDGKIMHKMTNTTEYTIWEGIIQRCNNKKNSHYKNYGGIGISVCDKWKKFIYFYIDMKKRPSKNHSIDRINNSIGYCKENCRWATRSEQSRNMRSNRWVEFQGCKMIAQDFAKHIGMSTTGLQYHLNKGRLPDDIIFYLKNKAKGKSWKKIFGE